jgi:hypothetical protein
VYSFRGVTAFLARLGKKVIPIVAELTGGAESIAKKVGLHVGDVLLDYDGVSYGGQTADSVLEWWKRFDSGPDRIRTLGILRDGKRLNVPVPRGKLEVRYMSATLAE